MLISSSTSSARPEWALKQARAVQQDIAKLGAQIQKLDNQAGVDTNPEIGKVEFSEQEFQSDHVSGAFGGSAAMVDGKLESFALISTGEHRVAGYRSSNGIDYSWAPITDGSMMVQSVDGSTRVTQTRVVDPNTPSEKLKHKLNNAKNIVLQAVSTAVPLYGAIAVSLDNFFNDTHEGYQLASITSNAVGTCALILGGMASSPALLGLAGVSLLTAGVSAGIQAAKMAAPNRTEPFQERTTWSYPAQK